MTIIVEKLSRFTGRINRMELPLSPAEYEAGLRRWRVEGEHIQHVFPELSNSQREFLMTGTTQEEWDAAFRED